MLRDILPTKWSRIIFVRGIFDMLRSMQVYRFYKKITNDGKETFNIIEELERLTYLGSQASTAIC